jgi:hypothetical protein
MSIITQMPLVKEYASYDVMFCSCGRETGECYEVCNEFLKSKRVACCNKCEARAKECADLAKRELAGEDYTYLLDLPTIAIPRSDGTMTYGGTILHLLRTFGSHELCARCTAEIGTQRLNKNVSLEDLAKVNPRKKESN